MAWCDSCCVGNMHQQGSVPFFKIIWEFSTDLWKNWFATRRYWNVQAKRLRSFSIPLMCASNAANSMLLGWEMWQRSVAQSEDHFRICFFFSEENTQFQWIILVVPIKIWLFLGGISICRRSVFWGFPQSFRTLVTWGFHGFHVYPRGRKSRSFGNRNQGKRNRKCKFPGKFLANCFPDGKWLNELTKLTPTVSIIPSFFWVVTGWYTSSKRVAPSHYI